MRACCDVRYSAVTSRHDALAVVQSAGRAAHCTQESSQLILHARRHGIQAIGPILSLSRTELDTPAAQHLGSPGLPHASQPQPEMAWSSNGVGTAIIGALAYNMGAGPT